MHFRYLAYNREIVDVKEDLAMPTREQAAAAKWRCGAE
jgi:hypothetical protein